MPRISFIAADGTRCLVDASPGQSVKDAALANDVPGILGRCGGFMMCGTCNGYIAPEWADRLPPPDEEELGMLENVLHRRPSSRLICQIVMTDELDGLEVELPAAQE